MAKIRFVHGGGEHVVEADRVRRDSQVYAAERREGGRWLRVATVPRDAVLRVQRQLPMVGATPLWIAEDVQTAAGLQDPAHPVTEVPLLPRERPWLVRSLALGSIFSSRRRTRGGRRSHADR